jgi:hypothetical protein
MLWQPSQSLTPQAAPRNHGEFYGCVYSADSICWEPLPSHVYPPPAPTSWQGGSGGGFKCSNIRYIMWQRALRFHNFGLKPCGVTCPFWHPTPKRATWVQVCVQCACTHTVEHRFVCLLPLSFYRYIFVFHLPPKSTSELRTFDPVTIPNRAQLQPPGTHKLSSVCCCLCTVSGYPTALCLRASQRFSIHVQDLVLAVWKLCGQPSRTPFFSFFTSFLVGSLPAACPLVDLVRHMGMVRKFVFRSAACN